MSFLNFIRRKKASDIKSSRMAAIEFSGSESYVVAEMVCKAMVSEMKPLQRESEYCTILTSEPFYHDCKNHKLYSLQLRFSGCDARPNAAAIVENSEDLQERKVQRGD